MKKLLYMLSLACLGLLYTGCREEEIDLYDKEQALTFTSGTVSSCNFTDEDYLNGVTTKEDSCFVQLQGNPLDAPRTFCIKAEAREGYDVQPTLDLVNPSTYNELNGEKQTYRFIVHRPEKPSTTAGCLLAFDYADEAHQFIKGRVEVSTAGLTVTYNIEPSTWMEDLWGAYSDGKYMFMMDTLGKLYDEMMYADVATVAAAYADYKAQGGASITDDEGNEITFPTTANE